jgi:RNA polymerase sigma-70 factor, ECF subfamily
VALRQDELTGLCDDVDLERDRALVERCQAGDSAAFGNLYARYYERLLRFCMRRLSDRHEAEDAAQEAFARAWKALPRFSGDKRFYPWLTVIAGNICTDMLRRRSRSTPTDDLELTAQQPLGAVANDTSEELVLAAVDGELVNRALGRLSMRHRHVLAMREGSGWTYQQIADHEGVEIGTIETLLWRARQALKREFAVVSESKGALAGFLVVTGTLFRRALFRIAHRGANMQQQAGGTSGGMGMRNVLAGVAVAGAAVAAAFIAPHALKANDDNAAAVTPEASALAAPPLALAPGSGSGGSGSGPGAAAGAGGPEGGSLPPGHDGSGASGGGDGLGGAGKLAGAAGGLGGTLGGALGGGPTGSGDGGKLGGAVSQSVSQATGGLGGAVNNVGTTVNGVTNGVGGAVKGLGGAVNGATKGLDGTVNGATGTVNGAVNGTTGAVNGTLNGVSQGVSGLLGSGSSGSGGSGNKSTTTTTTTTLPNVLKDVGETLGGLLGG